MIEELKLMIPLLREAGQGTFWLVLIMLVKEAFTACLWPAALYLAGRAALRAALVSNGLNTHTDEK